MLNDDDESQDALGSLSEMAISQHEMYLSWVAAGFTPDQALELLKTVVSQIVRGSTGC